MQSPIHLLLSSNEDYNGSHNSDAYSDDQNGVYQVGLSHDTSLKVLKVLLISLHFQSEKRLTAYCALHSTPLQLACQPNSTKGSKKCSFGQEAVFSSRTTAPTWTNRGESLAKPGFFVANQVIIVSSRQCIEATCIKCGANLVKFQHGRQSPDAQQLCCALEKLKQVFAGLYAASVHGSAHSGSDTKGKSVWEHTRGKVFENRSGKQAEPVCRRVCPPLFTLRRKRIERKSLETGFWQNLPQRKRQ